MILIGTKFQLKVWNYLKKIPKGKVKTYLEVAAAIGDQGHSSAYAAGDACRHAAEAPGETGLGMGEGEVGDRRAAG